MSRVRCLYDGCGMEFTDMGWFYDHLDTEHDAFRALIEEFSERLPDLPDSTAVER